MNELLLTFGIPVYNTGHYINDLLSCFKEVDDIKYEILIIDDGSRDDSYSHCLNLKKKFCNLNIRVYSQKNHGVSYTRNKLIEYSKAKWITFVDSDDLINFDLYINSFRKIVNRSIDIYINTYSYSKLLKVKTLKNALWFLIEEEIINSPCSKFYSINFLKEKKITFDRDIDLGEDLLFNLNLYKNSNRIDYFSSKMYLYRHINGNSLTMKFRENKFSDLMSLNYKCCELFNDRRIIKSFEFIKIKNCFSCLKDYILNGYSNDIIIGEIHNMKKIIKRKYLYMNSIKSSIIYLVWFLTPPLFLVVLIRWIMNEKIELEE